MRIHTKDIFINLGVERMCGSFNAAATLNLIIMKLKEYGLELSDIVCGTTDGAPIMEAVGKIAEWLYQLFMAHCLHLAVTDVIYAKNSHNYESYIEPCDSYRTQAKRGVRVLL